MIDDEPLNPVKKRNQPHYKEMYESAMSELRAQRITNKLHVALFIIGWVGFLTMVAITLIQKF